MSRGLWLPGGLPLLLLNKHSHGLKPPRDPYLLLSLFSLVYQLSYNYMIICYELLRLLIKSVGCGVEWQNILYSQEKTQMLLFITGERMNWGCRQEDYHVEIGQEECNVTDLSSNQLVCQPPSDPPLADPKNSAQHRNKEIPHVKVLYKINSTCIVFLYFTFLPPCMGSLAQTLEGYFVAALHSFNS